MAALERAVRGVLILTGTRGEANRAADSMLHQLDGWIDKRDPQDLETEPLQVTPN